MYVRESIKLNMKIKLVTFIRSQKKQQSVSSHDQHIITNYYKIRENLYGSNVSNIVILELFWGAPNDPKLIRNLQGLKYMIPDTSAQLSTFECLPIPVTSVNETVICLICTCCIRKYIL